MALGHVTFFCQLFIKVINESVGMNKNIVTNLHLLFFHISLLEPNVHLLQFRR